MPQPRPTAWITGGGALTYARPVPDADEATPNADAEDADDGRRGRERGGWTRLCRREFDDECWVSACAWTPGGESLVVGVGREVHALGVGPNLAATLANAAAPLPFRLSSGLEVAFASIPTRLSEGARKAMAEGRAGDAVADQLASLSVPELKGVLSEHGWSSEGVVEKEELVQDLSSQMRRL